MVYLAIVKLEGDDQNRTVSTVFLPSFRPYFPLVPCDGPDDFDPRPSLYLEFIVAIMEFSHLKLGVVTYKRQSMYARRLLRS